MGIGACTALVEQVNDKQFCSEFLLDNGPRADYKNETLYLYQQLVHFFHSLETY